VRSQRLSQTSNTFNKKGMEIHMRSTFGITTIHLTLRLTPSSNTVHMQEQIQTLHVSHPSWNPNPKTSICQLCGSLKTFSKARLMQSILESTQMPKLSFHHSNLKWDQMGWRRSAIGAALFWMWGRAQPSSAGGESVSGPALLVRLKQWVRVFSQQEVKSRQHLRTVCCNPGLN